MSDLVLGGTGTVGREVVRGLLAQGREVRVLTRSADRAREISPESGVVVGDLLDPRTFAAAFAGAERVFLLNALSQTEVQEGVSAVNEARRAGAAQIVYLSVHRADEGAQVPHFASKIAVEAAIRASGVPFTILRPSSFLQNDLAMKDAIMGYGIYPQPLGSAGVPRVDVRDIAEAAVNAMTRPGHQGRVYSLVGPQPMTGEEIAAGYSAALRREVRYGGDDLDAWEQVMLTMLPRWRVYDLKLMYAHIQAGGLRALPGDLAQTEEILGRAPRSFQAFVGEVASAWTGPPVPLPPLDA